MLDEALENKVNKIIALQTMLDDDETLDVCDELVLLRTDAAAELHKRYGDLFRLLIAAKLIDFEYLEGESGAMMFIPDSYIGISSGGGGLTFVKYCCPDMTAGRFMEMFGCPDEQGGEGEGNDE